MSLPTKRILALPAGTLPLTGFEAFEAVQAGQSVQLAGRAFVLPTDSLLTVSAMGGSLPGSRRLTAGTGITFVDTGAGGTFQVNATGAVAGPANPTALVGPTAINGVAITYMRSDAAPAFNQAAAYALSGLVAFTKIGTSAFDPSILLASTLPVLSFNETDAAVNNRLWALQVNSEQFRAVVSSDLGVQASWLIVDRTANVIDSIELAAITLIHTGSSTFSGPAFFNDSATSQIVINNSVAGANAKNTVIRSNVAGNFRIASATDAAPSTQVNSCFNAERTGVAFTAVGFGNSTDNPTFTFNGTGSTSFGGAVSGSTGTWSGSHTFTAVLGSGIVGPIQIVSTQPGMLMTNTGSTANNKTWADYVVGTTKRFNLSDDAGGIAAWLIVTRSLNVATAIDFTATNSGFTQSANAFTSLFTANSDGGTAAAVRYYATNGVQLLSAVLTGNGYTGAANLTGGPTGGNVASFFTSSTAPLSFGTNSTERVRITGAGVVSFPATAVNTFLIGTNATIVNGYVAQVLAGGSDAAMLVKNTSTAQVATLWSNATAGDNIFLLFATETAITARGSIDYNRAGGLTRYNTTSDERLKENIKDSPNESGDLVDRIRVRQFNWKDNKNHLDYWLVAQELYQVVPYAVSVGDDTRSWGLDASTLVPLLFKEVQSLRARLSTLETQPALH